ncbi:MAG: PAS domain-containing protein, partial [Ginsengibacter sp.]
MQQTTIDFKSVFQAMPGIGIILLPDSPNFTIVGLTDDLIKLGNLNRNEMIGKSFFYFFEESSFGMFAPDKAIFIQSLEQVISSGKSGRMETQQLNFKKEGALQAQYWSPVITPVFDTEGNLQYIFHTAENVTEAIVSKRESETAAKNFESYLNQATAPFAILTGAELEFTFANKAYLQLMNGRDLIGKHLLDAIPELKDQEFARLLEQVYETGEPFHASEIPATALFEGGSEVSTRYFNLSYTSYKSFDGLTKGVLASGYDVTEEVISKRNSKQQLLNQQAYDLFMQAPVGFSLLRGDNHIVELVNSMALRFTGRDQESIGKPV